MDHLLTMRGRSFLKSLWLTLNLSENIRVMAIRSLITEVFFGMFYVVWQPYAIHLGATVPQLGLVQGVMTLSSALGSLLWGKLSDLWGRKPIIVVSILLRVTSLIFCFIAKDWIHLIGFGVFMGLSATWQQTNPAESALVTESVESSRIGTAVSVYMSIGLLASIVMASPGGYLALNNGYWIIFLSCIAAESFNTIYLSLRLKETLKKSPKTIVLRVNLYERLSVAFRFESELTPFYAINFIGSFSYGVSSSILYSLLVDALNFNTVQLGFMSTMFGLSWGLSQLPVGWLMDKYGRKMFLMLSEASNMIVMTGFILSREFPVFLILQVFSGLAHAMWIPAHLALFSERVPSERRSMALGKLSTYSLLIGVPAPYIGGVLYESLGFAAPMLVRLASVAASLLVVYFLIEESR
ncbi:MFS transporter [Candidatus Bathyarchaeota archaeon]|nr:MFS transporter [Candidatus Bathyarchaeota archaeon]